MSSKATAAVLLLPKTNFPVMVKGIARAKLDKRLASVGEFDSFYAWQRQRKISPPKPSGDMAATATTPAADFVLLDGPPYANGELHVGHAINKLLKDFILRSHVQVGQRVHYRPGWDCHGLPIELRVQQQQQKQRRLQQKNNDQHPQQEQKPHLPSTSSTTTTENHLHDSLWVRHCARQVADASTRSQMDTFLHWGCIGDFARPYQTMQSAYVARQLELFARLFDMGLVRRALQPVFWSPSSRTALAESELEYNSSHKSTAVYFRFQMINFDLANVRWVDDAPPLVPTRARPVRVYALTWTTTPWTLPMNNAVAVNAQVEYALVDFPKDRKGLIVREVYIVAKALVPHISAEFGFDIAVLGTISGSQLADGKLFYRNVWADVQALPLLGAPFVSPTVGTGLVHVAYAHGQDDFELGRTQEDKQRIHCFVDERGCYTREMGHELCWKSVLGDGQEAALKRLHNGILHRSDHVHAYPYDWRTNQPVIIRCCPQWFIDVGEVRKRCLSAIEGDDVGESAPALRVSSGSQDLHASLATLFRHRRDWWCVSRQRVWGVPIPAIRLRDTGEVRTNSEFIRSIAGVVAEAAHQQNDDAADDIEGEDKWWTMPLEQMAKLEGFPFDADQLDKLEKFTEVMDVWLDSGLAWHTLLLRPGEECSAVAAATTTTTENDNDTKRRVADLVVEGADQFRGWFQTSMLTSMALQNTVPFKRILVHGMAVDEQGKKMSKSKGNVVDPKTITGCDEDDEVASSTTTSLSPTKNANNNNALGVDTLRLWCAWLASESSGNVSIGPKTLKLVEARLRQIRLILRFILGSLDAAAEAKRKSGTDLADLLMPVRNSALSSAPLPEGQQQLPLFALEPLDKYILAELDNFMDRLADLRSSYRFATFVEQYFQFLQNRFSSQYIHFVRDRLYCDPVNSPAHDAVLVTLDIVGHLLISAIAPILPHLAMEYFVHHPLLRHQPAEAFRQAFVPETGIELLRRSPALQNAIGDRAKLAHVMDAVRQQMDKQKTIADDERTQKCVIKA